MKNFIKKSTILMIGDIATKIISVLYLIPLVRLNETIILLMTNLLVPFGTFIVLSTLGVNVILTNELVKAKDDIAKRNVVLSIGILLSIITVISIFIMYLITPLVMKTIEGNPQYVEALVIGSRILIFGIILFSITSYLRSILFAYGDYNIISITYVSEQLIRVGLILVGVYYTIIKNKNDVTVVIKVFVVAVLFSMLTTLFVFLYHFFKRNYYKLFFQGKYQFKLYKLKYFLGASLVLFIGGIYMSLFDLIDLLLLNKQMTIAGYSLQVIEQIKVEYFTMSLKIVMIPILISNSFINIMIKQIGEANKGKKEINNILFVVSLYSIFSFVGIMLLGQNVYQLFYGEVGTKTIIFQSLIIPVYIIKNIIQGYIITNHGKAKSIFISTGVILSLKIILDILLFSLLGIYGYILATILSLISGLIVLVLMNKELFYDFKNQVWQNIKLFIKAIALILVNVVIFLALPNTINIFVLLILQSIIFVLSYALIYLIDIKRLLH